MCTTPKGFKKRKSRITKSSNLKGSADLVAEETQIFRGEIKRTLYLLVKFFPEGPSSPSYIYISSKSLNLFAWIFFTLLFVCRDGSNSKYVRPGSLEDSLSNVSLGMIPTHPTLTNIDTHSIHHKIFGNEEQVQEIQRQKHFKIRTPPH